MILYHEVPEKCEKCGFGSPTNKRWYTDVFFGEEPLGEEKLIWKCARCGFKLETHTKDYIKKGG
ncbi:hypothetical protein LCGC14_1302520 [marine sediment metagenome]|uniref:Uncharacterized protein n=1 Tax=marine sediment metagenome TaxID=412755 RepID=A0A0F9KPI8_9ZZZZ